MGELVTPPVVLEAAIVGLDSTDRVLEVIQYPDHPGRRGPETDLTDYGLTHVGLTCDDVVATRAELERRGVQFLTTATAAVAGVRTTWFRDPWGVTWILVEKGAPERPYWRQ
jgi:hypothetical protein